MGIRLGASIGPTSSTGSPVTFISRPSVSSPTGTVIGAPVSITSIPRTRPSVESIEMHRTMLSPRCCATSSTRLNGRSSIDGLVTRSALRIDGSEPLENSTSMTLPKIWLIRPVDCSLIAASFPAGVCLRSLYARRRLLTLSAPRGLVCSAGELGSAALRQVTAVLLAAQGFGAADDIHQLPRDSRLARTVHFERQPRDHVRCIVGCTVHRGHARPKLARFGLEQRMEHRVLDVAAQHHGDEFRGARLDEVIGLNEVIGLGWRI